MNTSASTAIETTENGIVENWIAAFRPYIFDYSSGSPFDLLEAIGREFFQTQAVFLCVFGTGDNKNNVFIEHSLISDTSSPADPLIVLDTELDERFHNLRLPSIRFYAAAALKDKAGRRLGAFCVLDRSPRLRFSCKEKSMLVKLARLASHILEQQLLPARLATAEDKLVEANERYVLATRATTDGIWDWNCVNGEVYYSPRWCHTLGLPNEERIGTLNEWMERLHPDDLATTKSSLNRLKNSDLPMFEGEHWIRHEDGSWRWVQTRGIAVRDLRGKLFRVAGSMTDITKYKMKDPLTGLHSRASLLDALEYRVRTRKTCNFALLLVDIDHFQRVNNSLGHELGDLLLGELGRRMEQTVSCCAASLVARLSSDEFAIVLDGVSHKEDALTYAYCLQYLIEAPVTCGLQQISVSASMGIAVGDDTYRRPEQFLHDADIAMHQAKAHGRSQSVMFTKNLREQTRERMILESELRKASARSELAMHYQPKVVLSTGEVIGFEALIRWQHAGGHWIPPGQFISVAEESDLILELGRWTLNESIQQLAEWRSRGVVPPEMTVAVNLSAKQFSDRHLVEDIIDKLRKYDLPSSCLELEVTEGILILDAAAALKVLERLKAIGVRLALDDFGTGYSSMSYLRRFPFDSLKIDRSFVQDIVDSADAAAIAQSIIALGRALSLRLTAEGVETAEQAQRLQAMGCQYAQGYLFSRPLAQNSIERYLTTEKKVESKGKQTGNVRRLRNLNPSTEPTFSASTLVQKQRGLCLVSKHRG